MSFVHDITKLRYEITYRLKLDFCYEVLERIIKFFYRLPYVRKGICSEKKDKKVIISLTTIPSRLDKVWLTTESLLRQSKKPDKVILWLAEEEFQGTGIPQELKRQQKRGLEIRYCKNLKSYKKFYYTMLEYPKDYVLVVDDDYIYSERLLAEMMNISAEYPDSIVCNRAHKIRADKNGIFPYLRWIWYENRRIREEHPSFHNFFTGSGGVLFPVWLLNKELYREDIFMEIAPYADDVWLNFNAWKSGIKSVMTKGALGCMLPIHSSSDKGLALKNIAKKTEAGECENDFQIRDVFEYLSLNINEYI